MKVPGPTDASIILTYRCPMRCSMCGIWHNPTDRDSEITAADLRSLPDLKFINLTGGEPFLRDDLGEIIEECYRHAPRIVISTSGWYDERVVEIARDYPQVGIRISLEGMAQVNDALRGRGGGFDKGLRTLLALKTMGHGDIGFGCTVSDRNSGDMLRLYRLARDLDMEFATAAVHNSYYFHKSDNKILDRDKVAADLHTLSRLQLGEASPKSWFRAFFNMGLANYVNDRPRLLPCEAGTTNFFIDPYGEIYPCNGLEERYWKMSMGNIREGGFTAVWESRRAAEVRAAVACCPKNCWMIGTAAPVMKKYLRYPLSWVIKNKARSLLRLTPVWREEPYI